MNPEIKPLTLDDVQAYELITEERFSELMKNPAELLQAINTVITERNNVVQDSLKVVFTVHDLVSALGLEEIGQKSSFAIMPFLVSKLSEGIDLIKNKPHLINEFSVFKHKYGLIIEERQKQLDIQKAIGNV